MEGCMGENRMRKHLTESRNCPSTYATLSKDVQSEKQKNREFIVHTINTNVEPEGSRSKSGVIETKQDFGRVKE